MGNDLCRNSDRILDGRRPFSRSQLQAEDLQVDFHGSLNLVVTHAGSWVVRTMPGLRQGTLLALTTFPVRCVSPRTPQALVDVHNDAEYLRILERISTAQRVSVQAQAAISGPVASSVWGDPRIFALIVHYLRARKPMMMDVLLGESTMARMWLCSRLRVIHFETSPFIARDQIQLSFRDACLGSLTNARMIEWVVDSATGVPVTWSPAIQDTLGYSREMWLRLDLMSWMPRANDREWLSKALAVAMSPDMSPAVQNYAETVFVLHSSGTAVLVRIGITVQYRNVSIVGVPVAVLRESLRDDDSSVTSSPESAPAAPAPAQGRTVDTQAIVSATAEAKLALQSMLGYLSGLHNLCASSAPAPSRQAKHRSKSRRQLPITMETVSDAGSTSQIELEDSEGHRRATTTPDDATSSSRSVAVVPVTDVTGVTKNLERALSTAIISLNRLSFLYAPTFRSNEITDLDCTVRVEKVFGYVSSMLRGLGMERNVRIQWTVSPQVEEHVFVLQSLRNRLEQALLAVLANAIEASPPEGVVRMVAEFVSDFRKVSRAESRNHSFVASDDYEHDSPTVTKRRLQIRRLRSFALEAEYASARARDKRKISNSSSSSGNSDDGGKATVMLDDGTSLFNIATKTPRTVRPSLTFEDDEDESSLPSSQVKPYILITVEDRGRGLTRTARAHVREVWSRAHAPSDSGGQWSGLRICAVATQELGGRAEMYSGKGTRVRLWIPVQVHRSSSHEAATSSKRVPMVGAPSVVLEGGSSESSISVASRFDGDDKLGDDLLNGNSVTALAIHSKHLAVLPAASVMSSLLTQ